MLYSLQRATIPALAVVFLCQPMFSTAGAQPQPPQPPRAMELGASLGLTKDNNSLPLWSQPNAQARADLGAAARQFQKGIVLVGHPKIGLGTAWVISKEHRLLATNAHVADMLVKADKMFAIVNESTHPYEIKRVWYHPGVRRMVSGAQSLSVLSSDPQRGPVFPNCPDVAVLELAEGGPELPTELEMALPEDLENLLGQTTAIFGFPGHDTQSWPGLGESPVGTLHDGVVSRVTDFHNGTKRARQQLQYTMSTWSGFSGSPVFLPSGRVVAIHNMARAVKHEQTGQINSLAHGVRIDCLWELLAHHGLHEKIPLKIDLAKLDIERWLQPDERDELAERVRKMSADASHLIFNKEEFIQAMEMLDEGVKLAPDYAEFYSLRSSAIANFKSKNWNRLTLEGRKQLIDIELENAKQAAMLNPSNTYYILCLAQSCARLGNQNNDQAELNRAFRVAEELLQVDGMDDYGLSSAHHLKAEVLRYQSRHREALTQYAAAIRIAPNVAMYYENRAFAYDKLGRRDLAQADRAKAAELRKQQAAQYENQ